MALNRRDLLVGAAATLTLSGCGVLNRPPPREAGRKPPGGGGGGDEVGSKSERIELGGRDYLLYPPPPSLQDSELPLIIALHGGGSHNKSFATRIASGRIARTGVAMVAAPNGTMYGRDPESRTFNAGFIGEKGVDDVSFIMRVVEDARKRHRVDDSRIWLMGFSNGAMMAYRMAAKKPGTFAAIGVNSGAYGGRREVGGTVVKNVPADGAPAVSIYAVHGAKDNRVRAEGGLSAGGTGRVDLPLKDAISVWAGHNACGGSVPNSFPTNKVWKAPDGRNGARLWVRMVPDHGHSWYKPNNEEMLEFFQGCPGR